MAKLSDTKKNRSRREQRQIPWKNIDAKAILRKGVLSHEDMLNIARYLRVVNKISFSFFAKCWRAIIPVHGHMGRTLPHEMCEEILRGIPKCAEAFARGLTTRDILTLISLGKDNLVLPKCPVCGSDIHSQSKSCGFSKTCSLKCGWVACNNKRQATALKNWGVDYVLQSKKFIASAKASCQKRYNTDNWASSKEAIRYKADKTYTKLLNLPLCEICFTKEQWQGFNRPSLNGGYLLRCKVCGKHYLANTIARTNAYPKCPDCFPEKSVSKFQKEAIGLLKTFYKGEVSEQNRTILHGRELDAVFPKERVAIEINGDYWHSEHVLSRKKKDNSPETYHLRKTEECDCAGYKLIHIFEHEWLRKRQTIVQRLRTLLGDNDEIYYARKCKLRRVPKNEAETFLREYHTQGSVKSTTRLGLYYNNKLVALMVFKKQRRGQYQYELQRFCSRGRVVGGASKLYKHFLSLRQPSSVVSYADRKWSTGFDFYKVLGLELTETLPPSYQFVFTHQSKKNTKKEVATEAEAQHILKGKYNPDKSDADNLIKAGYCKLWDCGQLVFSKIYS